MVLGDGPGGWQESMTIMELLIRRESTLCAYLK